LETLIRGHGYAARVWIGGARELRHRSASRRVAAFVACVAVGGAVLFAQPAPAEVEGPQCDPIDPAVCLQPFPNDYFTVSDPSTTTGRRLNLPLSGMPRNVAGKPIDPTDMNRSDGFSPGEAIVTRVPGLDNPQAFAKTGAVPVTDMARAMDPAQPIVVIDAQTLKRQLIWSEIDSAAKSSANSDLFVRPARNWQEGHRYIVALRNLKDSSGNTIPAGEAFRVYRDKLASLDPRVAERRPHMEEILGALARAGIQRGDLFLAWDFTVASGQDRTQRMLAIRDDAFAHLGDTNLADLTVQGASPQFEVSTVTDFTAAEDPYIAREVKGTVTVPCYLAGGANCNAGQHFVIGSNGLPQRSASGTWKASFICHIPRVALEGRRPRKARPSLYGHGLFGSASEINQRQLKAMGQEHNIVYCATDWIGMSHEDLETTIGVVIPDLSNFNMLVDRTQQGWLDALYLGRAMIHPEGFGSNPAFQTARGRSVIDGRRLFYDGNSQGGILGGGLAAVAPDYQNAVLGVPGMNFSTLLNRSTDFYGKELTEAKGTEELSFSSFLFQAYPNELERPLIYDLLQILWDRSEADGYAEHLTSNPLPNTPVHHVLLDVAFGDHQVANVAAEVEARTIGARVAPNPIAPGRSTDVAPYYGIKRIRSFPFHGSAMMIWDGGTPAPPTTNTPPDPPKYGFDPHEFPRNDRAARQQKSEFLKTRGKLIDVCAGAPCKIDFNPADGWTGSSEH
jgi:hypothetical protein